MIETQSAEKEPEQKKEPVEEIIKELEAEVLDEETKDATNEPAKTKAEPEAVEEPDKYMLLKYLFKFIETEEHPVNPVLAGYFAKLLVLLLNRKQKQIVPFIFSEECTVIDKLMYHVYQKSVSDVLHKILNVSD